MQNEVNRTGRGFICPECSQDVVGSYTRAALQTAVDTGEIEVFHVHVDEGGERRNHRYSVKLTDVHRLLIGNWLQSSVP